MIERASTSRFVAALCKAIIVWVAFVMFGEELSHAYGLGDEHLTDSGDAYSEANDVRAGEGYAVMGLTSNYGLPEVSFGNRFESQGGKHDNLMCESTEKCVYLHYPPGPELAMGVMTKVFGAGRVFAYRIPPIILGLVTTLLLAAALFRAIGPVRAAWVVFLLGRVPMTSNMMHVFTTHEYATAAYLLEVAALVYTLSQPTTRRWHVAAVALSAFLEGWTAFDYAFIVALTPLVVFLGMKDIRNPVSRRRLYVLLTAACGAYALAVLMHFAQVSLFLGGAGKALADFAGAAKNRSVGPTWVKPPIPGGLGIVIHYFAFLLPDKKFYDGNFVAFLAVVIAIAWPKCVSLRVGRFGELVWRSGWSELASFVLMLVAACLWLVVMQQHASIHGHFVPRLFESVVLWGYVVVARSLSLKHAAPDEARPDEALDDRAGARDSAREAHARQG